MTVEMCGGPRQLHGWRTHVSTAIVPLATLRGDTLMDNKHSRVCNHMDGYKSLHKVMKKMD